MLRYICKRIFALITQKLTTNTKVLTGDRYIQLDYDKEMYILHVTVLEGRKQVPVC